MNVYGMYLEMRIISLAHPYQVFVSGVGDNFTIGNFSNLSKCFVRIRGNANNDKNIGNGTNQISIEEGNINIDGVTVGTYDPTLPLASASGNVHLFNPCNDQRQSNISVYALKLYDINGGRLFDGVPQQVNGVAGMYDNVTETFIAASGNVTCQSESDVRLYQKSNNEWNRLL